MRLLAALVLVAVAVPAVAATDPGLKCLASKLKAAAKGAAGGLVCHAKAAKSGAAVEAACLGKAEGKLQTAHAKAVAKGGCLTDDGVSRESGLASGLVADVAARLRPTPGASSCQSAKLKAAAKRVDASLKAHAKNVAAADPVKLTSAFAKLRTKFADAFAKADEKADCATANDATVAAGAVDAWLDNAMAGLRLVARGTESQPSPVAPPNTPGTAGVTVTNPKLITQFGGSTFSLNNVTWTRWRLNGPLRTPSAVLILVPGFGGGAGNFEALAENLIPRMLEDHGRTIEVWGYDRRTEQLEDRAGALLAGTLADPLVALDWYYGAELSLPLSPALSGLGRRALFYNTTSDVPFLANWTNLVFSRDIDAVVAAANALAGGNVFLGGHSAGTGFAARYAATDFNLTGVGSADPGYARLRGVVLLEGGGGSTGTALTSDSLDRIEAKFDGGLFGAVRDGAGRCVDGTTACTLATEAVDCTGQTPAVCTPASAAHGVILGISPKILAAAEPVGIQALTDADGGQAIVQVDQGSAGNNAVAKVPELSLLSVLAPGTADALYGSFLDDDGLLAAVSAALAVSVGGPGPIVGGLLTWLDPTERAGFPSCPGTGCLTPDNGPAPTAAPGGVWGPEKEVTRIDRLRSSFSGVEGANASDWYYPISGLGTTTAPGLCVAGVCAAGNVGAACATDGNCAQSVSLDSTALSLGRGRRDIENLTQVANVNVPVLCIGGSNGLTPTPARYIQVAQALGMCTAPSCTGAPRVVDATVPNTAFPTFGGVAGGFEVVIAQGFAHVDVVAAEDDADNPVVGALADFIDRNVP